MENLKEIRNELLKLHKTLMEIEKQNYETKFGKVTNVQLLNLLIEDPSFKWLRDISGLVAQMDEFFAAQKGFDPEVGLELIQKAKNLFIEDGGNGNFLAKFQINLETESSVSGQYEKLIKLFKMKRRETSRLPKNIQSGQPN